jgi:uncharacterized protein YdaU (DUF1376 family)
MFDPAYAEAPLAEFPALPLFTDAYLADTEHLSDAEHGIYLKILMIMWRSPNCRLPNDDKWLARRLRKTVAEVEKQVRPIIDEFCQNDGNWLAQKRLQKEWEWCRYKRKRNSDSAKSMWDKKKGLSNGSAGTHSVRNATDSGLRNAPFPSLPYLSRGITKEEREEDSEERSSG